MAPQTDLDGIHEQVARVYDVQGENVQVYEYPPSDAITTLVVWKHGFEDYSASFAEERLRRVAVRSGLNTANLGTILECLPEPEYYTFTFDLDVEVWRYDVTLWYPEFQLVVSTTRFQNTPAAFTPDESTLVTGAYWVSESSIENMARDMYPHADENLIERELLPRIIEWPGSLDLLELTDLSDETD